MIDLDLPPAKQNHEVKFVGTAHLVSLKVSTGFTLGAHETWKLTDASGVFSIVMPKAMLPFAQTDDTILVSLGFVKGEVVASSAILTLVK